MEKVILTRDNIPEVMEKTGYSEEQLLNLLEEMGKRGVYPVEIPLGDEPEWL